MATKKSFYAVKSNPGSGIYDNWMECKAVVTDRTGTIKKGVIFKGFPTREEAEEWMKPQKKVKSTTNTTYTHNPIISENVLNVYTDGSDRAGRLGIGAFSSYDNKEYFYGSVCNLKSYGITEACSNPTAEFIAVVEIIKLFRGGKFPIINELHIWTDYNGVPKWISGEFNCNEPHIKKIKSIYDAVVKELPKSLKLSVKWVKGHVGVYGNEHADKCAGGDRGEINTFPNLISYLENTYKIDKDGYSIFQIE